MLVSWVAFPAVLGSLALGCGLLLERAAALRLPAALVLPCGLAVLSLIAQFATMDAATARFAVPCVVSAAVGGVALTTRGRPRRFDLWSVATPLAVFAAYAAPVVLSGHATFAGYIKLDDGSTFLAMTDRVMEHGRSLAGLNLSSYLRTLQTNIAVGYPIATFMPLGVGSAIVGGDAIWLFQPYLAVMAAMLSLGLYQLTRNVIGPRWLRALAAFVGAQSALLYGYALWGGIKELGTAWALPILVLTVAPAVRGERARHLIPLAAMSALLLGVLNVGAFVWLAPALVFAFIAILRARGLTRAIRSAAAFAAFLATFSLPTIIVAQAFLTSGIVTYSPLANLVKPLSPLQLAGIWPTGDFRFDPQRHRETIVLVAVAVAAATAAATWSIRRRAWELPLFVCGAVASSLVLDAASTPWIAGKAFATASPAIPLAAIAACAPLFRSRRHAEGAVLCAVVAGGVLWSNVLQYHEASLAPRSQLAELSFIGRHFAGDGPSLMTEYQPYGVRHFLRRLDAEGASELRFRPIALRTGQLLPKAGYADIDDFQLGGILVYRTLVLRRSPVESRPPAAYHLVWHGRFYEVWQRPQTFRAILEHLSLGSATQPAAQPNCRDVLRLSRLAGNRGELAAVERPPVVDVDLSHASYPSGWTVGQSGELIPAGAGTVHASIDVPARGRYGFWLGGSFRDRLELAVDGRVVSAMRHQLNYAGQYTPLGTTGLIPGEHRVEIRYGGPDLHPGSGGPQFAIGPLVASTATADVPVSYVHPSDARSLCGRNLDWVEALGP